MKYRIMQHPSGTQKKVKVGFSWTTLFFSIWPSVFRSQWEDALKLLFIGPITLCIYNILKCFTINQDYYESLIRQGFIDVTGNEWGNYITETGFTRILKSCENYNKGLYRGLRLDEVRNLINVTPKIPLNIVAIIQIIVLVLIDLRFVINVLEVLRNEILYTNVDQPIMDLINAEFYGIERIILPCIIAIIVTIIILIFTEGVGNELNYMNTYNNQQRPQEYKKTNSMNITNKLEYDKQQLTELEDRILKANADGDFELVEILKEMIEEQKIKINGDK